MVSEDDVFEAVIYFYVWFIGWLITSNLILFSLGYRLHDTHVFIPIWILSILICCTIYPGLPKLINLFIKNPIKKIKILFELKESHFFWYVFVGPIFHAITSLSIVVTIASVEGHNQDISKGSFISYDIDRMYVLYGVLYPLIWSISALIWFFIIPIVVTLISRQVYEDRIDKKDKIAALRVLLEKYSDDFTETERKLLTFPSEKFIDLVFSKYDLPHYDSFIELINKSALYDNFYRLLPTQLRCLFENLLYDLFLNSLHASHKELFYLKSQNRPRDFSQLIHLLNFLKDQEFKPYFRDSINPKTIEILFEIQKLGNFTVHDVIRKVSIDFPKEWKDKINLVLEPLLVGYKKLKDKHFKIEDKVRIKKIKEKLGINK